MASDLKSAKKNPLSAVNIAVGDPFPKLVPQRAGSGIRKDGLYYSEPARFVLKKAHLAMDDFRVFDSEGNLVANSHHPGKNPLDGIDPFGMANTDDYFSFFGEWNSLCDVSCHSGGMSSFKVRGRSRTLHGRQRIKDSNDKVVMNIGKISRIKSASLRHSFEICRGDDKDDRVYTVTADLMGRTLQFQNKRDELIAVMAKTKKALILDAALGKGSENTIDIAPGVDCSVVIAAVFGVLQVGSNLIVDAAKNFVVRPAQDAAVDAAMDGSFLDGASENVGGALDGGAEALAGGAEAAGEALAGGAEAAGEAVAGLGGFLLDMFIGG